VQSREEKIHKETEEVVGCAAKVHFTYKKSDREKVGKAAGLVGIGTWAKKHIDTTIESSRSGKKKKTAWGSMDTVGGITPTSSPGYLSN